MHAKYKKSKNSKVGVYVLIGAVLAIWASIIVVSVGPNEPEGCYKMDKAPFKHRMVYHKVCPT
jgi:hypothetical protein